MLKERLKLSDFDYQLPKDLIAQFPCEKRDHSRLLVLHRANGQIAHQRFCDIVNYFSAGDCLVLNNTKVISARLIGQREKFQQRLGAGKQEIFLLGKLTKNVYRVLARPAKKLTQGIKILFNDGGNYATVLTDEGMTKIVRFFVNGVKEPWRRLGDVPLPPYIKRMPEDLDKERYQTVYAQSEGATAAPTAGLHFTKELIRSIKNKGVKVIPLTLHVNYGTFAPVKVEDITKHKMYKEYFILPQKTANVINSVRKTGRKVFAVGTTSVRVLETSATNGAGRLKAARGWTDLFIYPPYKFKVIDCLLTNFHFPKSTLLMLVSAFAGKELLFKAYQEAIKEKYRFFSYGDAMLIL